MKEYLKVLSTDEKIQSLNSTLPPIQNRVTFNFIFNIDRGITKKGKINPMAFEEVVENLKSAGNSQRKKLQNLPCSNPCKNVIKI